MIPNAFMTAIPAYTALQTHNKKEGWRRKSLRKRPTRNSSN
jgi:hypothetical protein